MLIERLSQYPPAPPPIPRISNWRGDICHGIKKKKILFLTLLLLLFNLALYHFFESYFLTQNDMSVTDHLTEADQMFRQITIPSTWGYIFTGVITILRLTFLTFVFQIPLLFKGVNIGFRKVFHVILTAGFVQSIREFGRLLKITTTGTVLTYGLQVTPLGILDCLDYDLYSPSAIVFLNQFNVFELLWCLVVYRGLSKIKRVQSQTAAFIVLSIWSFITCFTWGLAVYMELMAG